MQILHPANSPGILYICSQIQNITGSILDLLPDYLPISLLYNCSLADIGQM